VNRRAVLAALLSVPLAGCGWAQEDGGGGPDQQPGQGSDGSSDGGSSDDDGDTDDDSGTDEEDLATSEGGTDPIEKPAEELLLTLEDLDSEGWEETNAQLSGTCNTFAREIEEAAFDLHACASVYDDEPTAVEEYAGDLDRSIKLMTEELDVSPEVGDEATVVRESSSDGNFGEVTIRLLFRDTNATGTIDLISDTGLPTEGQGGDPEFTVENLVEFGARMHGHWRE
jgi:hypothetical protein